MKSRATTFSQFSHLQMLTYWQCLLLKKEFEDDLYVEIISFKGISPKMVERGFGFGFWVSVVDFFSQNEAFFIRMGSLRRKVR